MPEQPLIHALLVEDDSKLAALTKEYLEQHGVAVSVVTDGDRGVDEALRHSFDIVLLDIMLPGRSGLEVCQAIRQHRDLPIIMLTARGEEADRVIGLVPMTMSPNPSRHASCWLAFVHRYVAFRDALDHAHT